MKTEQQIIEEKHALFIAELKSELEHKIKEAQKSKDDLIFQSNQLMISIDSVGYPDLAEDNDIQVEKNTMFCDCSMPQFGNPKAAAAIKQFVSIQENIECLNMRIKYLEEMKSRLAAKPEVLKG